MPDMKLNLVGLWPGRAKSFHFTLLRISLIISESRAHSDVATRGRISIGSTSRPVRGGWSHLPSKDLAMQNGRKTPRHFKPGPPPISRPKRWTPNADRAKQKRLLFAPAAGREFPPMAA
jgi:hypothetical protein